MQARIGQEGSTLGSIVTRHLLLMRGHLRTLEHDHDTLLALAGAFAAGFWIADVMLMWYQSVGLAQCCRE